MIIQLCKAGKVTQVTFGFFSNTEILQKTCNSLSENSKNEPRGKLKVLQCLGELGKPESTEIEGIQNFNQDVSVLDQCCFRQEISSSYSTCLMRRLYVVYFK